MTGSLQVEIKLCATSCFAKCQKLMKLVDFKLADEIKQAAGKMVN